MLVAPNAAVAAANCFDGIADGKIDASPYTIAVGGDGLDAANIRTPVRSVAVHPNYNPQLFSNNIAVVVFDKVAADGAAFQVGDLPSEWPAFDFVYRSLNEKNAAWDSHRVVRDTLADTAACGHASRLFAQNQRDFICNTATLQSPHNSACVLPYRNVIGVGGGHGAQLGLYSHSAIPDGTEFCGSAEVHNYYVLLANYIPWINSHIVPGLTTYHRSNAAIGTSNVSYQMNTTGLGPDLARTLYSNNNLIPAVQVWAPSNELPSSEMSSDTVSAAPTKTVYSTITTTVTEYSGEQSNDSGSTQTTTVTLSGELTIVSGSVCPTAATCESVSDSESPSNELSVETTTVTVSVSGPTTTISVTVTEDHTEPSSPPPNCPTDSNAQGLSGSKGMATGEIVAIIIGSVVAGFVLLAGIGFLVYKRCCGRQPDEDEGPEPVHPAPAGYAPQPPFNPNYPSRMQPVYAGRPQYNTGAP
ncbi:hypothetical protein IWQ56_000796 [Coemansia nantahalensis]|nr:hypothetical protein IWQ56_000796 [Coemansia nantahalensis]